MREGMMVVDGRRSPDGAGDGWRTQRETVHDFLTRVTDVSRFRILDGLFSSSRPLTVYCYLVCVLYEPDHNCEGERRLYQEKEESKERTISNKDDPILKVQSEEEKLRGQKVRSNDREGIRRRAWVEG